MAALAMKNPLPSSASLLLLLLLWAPSSSSLLYPIESESRETKSLDGVWNFRLGDPYQPDQGFEEEWFRRPLSKSGRVDDMPVPASYNDIPVEKTPTHRDHVGWAWYDRTFRTPSSWVDGDDARRIMLRVGAARYSAVVWLNGEEIMSHSGGHLPFEADVTAILNSPSDSNLLTVAVNNTLTPVTIPQGEWVWYQESDNHPAGFYQLEYTFDFFNYAGIHRPVTLYSVPASVAVQSVAVDTTVSSDLTVGTVAFDVTVADAAGEGDYDCSLRLLDADEGVVTTWASGCSGSMDVSSPTLWWPYTMSEDPGYLYTLEVTAFNQEQTDVYRLNVGIRHVSWDEDAFKINHRDFYFRGVNKHEDSAVRGKGLDLATTAKDFRLLEWLGSNSFRTSHYPYAEEIMDMADRHGIVVIDECPGVNLHNFDDVLLQNHKDVMQEMISRDRNHPSVVMWSIANEPVSEEPAARDYFQSVADHVHSLDPLRPVTAILHDAAPFGVALDNAAYSVDIIGLNKYSAWYNDLGHLELIQRQVTSDLRKWKEKHDKPIMVTEYGADTITEFHEMPATIFTEEYQTELMMENFAAFDTLRSEGILVGEMIWNFADFMTQQELRRAWGNRKGVFTRDRKPKSSAHLLRARYWKLAQEEGGGGGGGTTTTSSTSTAASTSFATNGAERKRLL